MSQCTESWSTVWTEVLVQCVWCLCVACVSVENGWSCSSAPSSTMASVVATESTCAAGKLSTVFMIDRPHWVFINSSHHPSTFVHVNTNQFWYSHYFYCMSIYARAVFGVVILSVRLSVTCLLCDKTKWCTADILISHERAIILALWHQQWLVGDLPFKICTQSDPPLQNVSNSTN